MFENYQYEVEISLPFRDSNVSKFYNFPAINSFRVMGLHSLYNSNFISKEFLKKFFKNGALPKVDILKHKKTTFFCPCSVNSENYFDYHHGFTDFYRDKSLGTIFIDPLYNDRINEKNPPPTLIDPIVRDITVVIPTPECSLEFLRKCLSVTDMSGHGYDDCFKSFFGRQVFFSYDFFFYDEDTLNSAITGGSQLNDGYSIVNKTHTHTFIFVYFLDCPIGNIIFVLAFPQAEYKVTYNGYNSLYINSEFFSHFYSTSSFQLSIYNGSSWWLPSAGLETGYYNEWAQSQFVALK